MAELDEEFDVSNATCPTCGAPVTRKGAAGPLATYCTKKCRAHAQYLRQLADGVRKSKKSGAEKACPECDDSFVPAKTAKQRFCSPACAKRWQNKRDRAARPACSEPGCSSKSVSRGLCRRHHPQGKKWSKGDPETIRAARRKRTQQRRALTRDPEAEVIDRDAVGERDGWTCGLCGRKVNRLLAYPHPRSASLDHITPLSLGGRHILTNVQISHLECNLAKGNRGGGEQLLLIG